MHYIAGILFAWFYGIKGNKKYWYGLWAIVPDLDGILIALLMLGRRIFGYSLEFLEHNQFFVTFFSHRGFSHSLFLLALVIGALFLFKIPKRTILIISSIWASHLFLDYLTSWKFFPFLPFSFSSHYLGLVEIFDSFLVFFSTILFAFFIGMSIAHKREKKTLVFAYLFILFFGFFSSVFMNEFNVQTIILSQLFFWLIVIGFWYYSRTSSKKKCLQLGSKGIITFTWIIVLYLSMLFLSQVYYAYELKTPLTNIEPLEQFAFNNNAHTFEIDQGDTYTIGMITLTGIVEEKTIPKIVNNAGISEEIIDDYLQAYGKALHSNWFNHPVWTFYQDEEGIIYANVRYAKSFLSTEYIPGPQNGINITLEEGILVGYGRRWFS